MLLQVFLCFLDDLLDPARMNAPVLDQLLERELGDLAPDAVEAGDDDHSRRVVDDHVDSGCLLEGTDVPPLTADDPPLHLIVGDIDRADGHLGGVRRRVALNRRGQDFAALLLAGLLNDGLIFQDQASHFAAQLVFDAFQQHFARLLGRQAADAL